MQHRTNKTTVIKKTVDSKKRKSETAIYKNQRKNASSSQSTGLTDLWMANIEQNNLKNESMKCLNYDLIKSEQGHLLTTHHVLTDCVVLCRNAGIIYSYISIILRTTQPFPIYFNAERG